MTVSPVVSSSTDLVRFLLARVDDDDTSFRREARRSRAAASTDPADIEHEHLLERMKSESIARRQTLGHVQQLLILRDQPNEKVVRDVAAQILRSMAMPYADHASYRGEWRVSIR